jgi:hypothetical protein
MARSRGEQKSQRLKGFVEQLQPKILWATNATIKTQFHSEKRI